MKNFFLILVLLLNLIIVNDTYAQGWQWARGRSCSDTFGNDFLMCIKTDALNNVFIGGFYEGDSICIGNNTFYAHGPLETDTLHRTAQAIVAKYNSSGTLLWANADTWGDCPVEAMATDAHGNLYALGFMYSDSAQFGTYSLSHVAHAVSESSDLAYFLIKYDPSGAIMWAKTGGVLSVNGYVPASITTDAAGNIYLSASFLEATTKIGSYTLHNPDPGSADALVAKLDTDGNVLWAKDLGNNGINTSLIALNKDGNIYVAGSNDPSLIKLDNNGNVIWSKNGPSATGIDCINIDNIGNIYLGGSIWLRNDTITSVGSFNFVYPGSSSLVISALLIKYDTSGNIIDAKCLEPSPSVHVPYPSPRPFNIITDIATDSCSNVWVTGPMFTDAGIEFDNSTTAFAPAGSSNPAFIAEYGISGNLLHQDVLPSGAAFGIFSKIATDAQSNIYLTGSYSNNSFIAGNDTLADMAPESFYIAKYVPEHYCTLIIHEVANRNKDVVIYPIPATTSLHISDGDDIYTIAISNMLGQTIYRQQYSSHQVEIDISALPPGIYLIKINDTEVKKFIKE